MEPGLHEVVLLPVGMTVQKGDDGGPYFVIRFDNYMADYGLNPPPDLEQVLFDASDWLNSEDMVQLGKYLVYNQLVLAD